MRISVILQRVALCLTLPFVLFAPSSAQEEGAPEEELQDYSSTSFGIRVGYGWPIGSWREHPFAPVDQFRGGLTIGGDVEFRLSQKLGLAIGGGYTQLDASAWEEYAASQGDNISVSASVVDIGLSLRPYLRHKKPSVLKLDLGVLISFPSGREVGPMFSYEYDFMKSPAFGLLAGLEYEYFFSEEISAIIRGAFLGHIGGISYADGTDFSIMLAPVTGGLRVHL